MIEKFHPTLSHYFQEHSRLDKHPFVYQRPTPEHVGQITAIRDRMMGLHDFILETFKPSRERSLCITNLEQASMWINKHIVFNED